MSLKKPANIKITTGEGKLKENLVEITKKTLSFGLAATLAVTALPVSAFGQSADEADAYEAVSAVSEALPEEGMAEFEDTKAAVSGDYGYRTLSDGTAEITSYSGSAPWLEIPSTLDGYKVTSIYQDAFSGCTSLTSVTIPDGVTKIGDYAFAYCTSLINITIPASVTYIRAEAFIGSGLRSINVDSDNKYYKSVDGVLFTKDMTVLLAYPPVKLDEAYEIPHGVTVIAANAFSDFDILKTLTIPASVTSIEAYAFNDPFADLKYVYYEDTAEEWSKVTIGEENYSLINALIFFTVKPVVSTYPGNGKAVVTWDALKGATKYRVFYYLNGKYKTVRDVTGTSCTVTGLTNGTKYGFLVRAYVNGAWTSYTTADIVYATPIEKPVVTATAGSGKVRLDWAKVTGATKYAIYTYVNGKYTFYRNTTANYYNVAGLTNGTKYGFLVKAYVNGKWTTYNAYDLAYATPVEKPVVTAYAGNGKVRLNWTKVTGATKYAIYTYVNGKYTHYRNTTATAYNVTGLTNGTKYGFLVKAYVNGKWTTYNTYDLAYATPIDKPVITKAVAASGRVRLYWNKVAGATKYAIFTYSGGKYKLYKYTTANAYTVSGLKNGTAYGFLVRAYVNGKWTTYNAYDRVSATPKA